MGMTCDIGRVPVGMSETQRRRAIEANKVYCRACEENGVKVCAWEGFTGWQDYVDGKIAEQELAERATDELKNFTDTFRKYTVFQQEDPIETPTEDLSLRAKTKLANQIYKKACAQLGLSFCFFGNFTAWSEYVHGELDDTQFYEKVLSEVRRMAKPTEN
jgi:sugar phosphate isomerase/epimerase